MKPPLWCESSRGCVEVWPRPATCSPAVWGSEAARLVPPGPGTARLSAGCPPCEEEVGTVTGPTRRPRTARPPVCRPATICVKDPPSREWPVCQAAGTRTWRTLRGSPAMLTGTGASPSPYFIVNILGSTKTQQTNILLGSSSLLDSLEVSLSFPPLSHSSWFSKRKKYLDKLSLWNWNNNKIYSKDSQSLISYVF